MTRQIRRAYHWRDRGRSRNRTVARSEPARAHGQAVESPRDELSVLLRLKVSASLLAISLSCQSFFDSLLLAWLQVESMPLDLFDDVLLEDLPLETLERALQTLAVV
jgi:hypothetical protein